MRTPTVLIPISSRLLLVISQMRSSPFFRFESSITMAGRMSRAASVHRVSSRPAPAAQQRGSHAAFFIFIRGVLEQVDHRRDRGQCNNVEEVTLHDRPGLVHAAIPFGEITVDQVDGHRRENITDDELNKDQDGAQHEQ